MRPKIPNWNDLRIFLEVSRSGSFSKSARQMGLNVSTVSRHISHLEQCLNTPVFERDASGFKMTSRGHALLEHVQKMETHVLALSDFACFDTNQPSGAVRIGTMEGIGSFYLAQEFITLKQRHPLIDIQLVTSAHHVQVSHREADVFLSFFPHESKGLDVTPVGQFPLYLYASADYLASHTPIDCIEDLQQHDFISYIEDLVQLDTVRWLNEIIPHPRIVFHSTSMIAQMFAAASNGGMVILPAFMKAESFGLQRVLPEQVWLSRTVWLTVHRDLQYMPRIKAVTAFLKNIFERDYPMPPGISATTASHQPNKTPSQAS
jgi:DNA-binding transcriptional LysR family regulator